MNRRVFFRLLIGTLVAPVLARFAPKAKPGGLFNPTADLAGQWRKAEIRKYYIVPAAQQFAFNFDARVSLLVSAP